jgi:release factor glutamine methyltransferase
VAAVPSVYAPQEDSLLLIEAMTASTALEGRSVLDLCTGTGIVAIAAALLGASEVTAVDICRRAIRCTRRNARASGVRIKAYAGTHVDTLPRGPYDVVVCNPPYVPVASGHCSGPTGPSRAWDGGPDGRRVLDPLCASADTLLAAGGVVLIVQSEFADPKRTMAMLDHRGVDAKVTISKRIPFGRVLTEHAPWMESAGLLPVGRRHEELVVIRGEKR